MSTSSFEAVRERLTPEALRLFTDMVDLHLSSDGDRVFILARTFGASALIFSGNGRRGEVENVDEGGLVDLARYRLLHHTASAKGTPNYRVSGEGIAFHRWLMARQGEAVDQLDTELHRLVDGGAFARDHPAAAHHLREAMALLWQDDTTTQVVSEIGDHLRKALMDLTTDIVGPDGDGRQERPADRLVAWVGSRSQLGERERPVLEHLVRLADAVLRLGHRLNHVRDEADKAVPVPAWDEVRRATFVTTFACIELADAARS